MGIASDIQAGTYFLKDGEPVRVVRKEVVAVGTHSHTKLKIYYQGMIDRGEKTVNFSHSDKVDIVDIRRKQGQVISKSDKKVQIMDMISYETMDAEAVNLSNELAEGDIVTFVEFAGKVSIIGKR